MISRADLARLMVDLLEDPAAEGHAYALGTSG